MDLIEQDRRPRNDGHWSVASVKFCRLIDDVIRKRSPGGALPWERHVAVGQVDYWKVHSYALDRLDDLLRVVLPHGEELPDSTWRGRHDQDANWFIVSLLSGAWSEPATGKLGHDLVGLIACIYGKRMGWAAIHLARQLGIQAIRDV